MKAFVQNFDKLHTTNGLVSAMHCFGKYSGAATAVIAGRKRKAIAFANKRIGVQPTDVSRRSLKCFGRRVAGLGRPSKLTRSSEHGYGKVPVVPADAKVLRRIICRYVSSGWCHWESSKRSHFP